MARQRSPIFAESPSRGVFTCSSRAKPRKRSILGDQSWWVTPKVILSDLAFVSGLIGALLRVLQPCDD